VNELRKPSWPGQVYAGRKSRTALSNFFPDRKPTCCGELAAAHHAAEHVSSRESSHTGATQGLEQAQNPEKVMVVA